MSRAPEFGRYVHPDYKKHYSTLVAAEKKGKLTASLPLSKRGGFYGNTLLLSSLSYGHTGIALLLIMQTELHAPKVFRMHDQFSGSQSTPLILAAKTGNTAAACSMTASRHIKSFINDTDHFGNTAMHYACMSRNIELVHALHVHGADLDQKNKLGYSPEHYLLKEIDDDALRYRYGQYRKGHDAYLAEVSDFGYDFKHGDGYIGTKDPSFSGFRWFIQNLVLNLKLAKADDTINLPRDDNSIWVLDRSYRDNIKLEKQPSNKLRDILQQRARSRMPIMDARLYNDCCRLFTEHHHAKREQAHAFCKNSAGMETPPTIINDYFK